ncbi:serine/threonine-protein phosphatase 6 regulatory ankyrin repeat subunit C [Patella vulgata]|uniref:serine/threonine-protein phosphatase 6 regulatory ankyrin repeat subunit C n=1 Tax=Patella vulgata TaxID=6465 RepID=UPI00217F406A|nr:serine/threonine-protein phosphatase 6 regulatory ankyrin repeat subunit C [Patella vulgata]XP_050409273.1 serine/threonine-protein phosphatase 6 regulatory ankyrin repeat subunit C [Patella vulgata]XP_055957428.1 serine/threonine-protein phosphatase 6 regulatory ankyrin repeat subunit C [Patella vulgata]
MASFSGNFKMPRKDSERMQHHYEYFLDNVFNPDDLITNLFSKGVLDLDRKTRILNTETGRPRVAKLLDILMTECGDYYQIFLEALREKGFGPIADTLGKQKNTCIRGGRISKTKTRFGKTRKTCVIKRLQREINELRKYCEQNITLLQQNPLLQPERGKTKYQTDGVEATTGETKNQIEDSSKHFLLHHSAYVDDIYKFMSVLNQYKDSIDIVDNDGKTPLERACFSEFDAVHKVKLLVFRGYTSCITLVNIFLLAPIDLPKLIFDKTIYNTMNEFDQTRIPDTRKRLLQGGGLDVLDTNKKTLLHYACQYSTLMAVQYLIDNNCNVNCVDKDNGTPLFNCCYSNAPQAVEKMKVLVSNGAKLDVTDIDNESLLHAACCQSTVDVVQYLIDNNCNVNCVGGMYNRTPLFYCCEIDAPQAVEKMKVLVSNGANLDITDIDNTSLLHIACSLSTVDVVQYLIDNNCNVNCVGGKYNKTPVFYCCERDAPQAVEKMQVLVSNGANLDITDIDNSSLLHIACSLSTVDVVQYLIDCNCNVNCVDGKCNRTPVFYCCARDSPQAVEMMNVLVSNGANLDITDIDNSSLLHIACSLSTVDVVQYLIDCNCNVNCVDGKYNRTPVFYCCARDSPQAVEMMNVLVSNGANLDITDIDNTSLLHIACWLSTVDVVQYLIDNNCNVNCVGGMYNRTPLFDCCYKDVPQAVEKMKVLVSNGAKLDVTDIDNTSLLHAACCLSTVDVVQYLIDNNCNVNCVSGMYNRTPLFYCCYKDAPQAVEKMNVLVSNGAKLDFIDDQNTTPLHRACAFSTVKVVEHLIDSNCNVNYMAGRYNNISVFYSCCSSETRRIVKIKLLLSRGAKLNEYDKSSCIKRAQSLGYYDTVEFVKTIPV